VLQWPLARANAPKRLARVTPETARLLQRGCHYDFSEVRPFFGQPFGKPKSGPGAVNIVDQLNDD
jgi:hypothetical protein